MPQSQIERLIPLLICRDIEAAHEHLCRAFAFGGGELTRDPEGRVVHGEIHLEGGGECWLHEESPHFALKSPRNLGHASASYAVRVADVAAHHRHAAANGANILHQPVEREGGYREYSALDGEGHRWSHYTRPGTDAAPGLLTPILCYRDIEAARDYLLRAFAFQPGELMRNAKGAAFHAELHIGAGNCWLHGESQQQSMQSPQGGQASATFAVMVGDVDAHHRHAAANGAKILYPPKDQEYGYREYSARDSEDHLWSFMKPLG